MKTVKKKRSLVARSFRGGREGRTGGTEGIFLGRDPGLYNTTMVDPGHHTFVQTRSMYNTKSESSCKLWASGDDAPVLVHQL